MPISASKLVPAILHPLNGEMVVAVVVIRPKMTVLEHKLGCFGEARVINLENTINLAPKFNVHVRAFDTFGTI